MVQQRAANFLCFSFLNSRWENPAVPGSQGGLRSWTSEQRQATAQDTIHRWDVDSGQSISRPHSLPPSLRPAQSISSPSHGSLLTDLAQKWPHQKDLGAGAHVWEQEEGEAKLRGRLHGPPEAQPTSAGSLLEDAQLRACAGPALSRTDGHFHLIFGTL